MPIRGIRGAITVTADEPDLILQATRELLEEILEENEGMQPENVASAIFTVTDDLTSTFPAQAAREMGWSLVPMLAHVKSLFRTASHVSSACLFIGIQRHCSLRLLMSICVMQSN